MPTYDIPKIKPELVTDSFRDARFSPRKRHALILHQAGDYRNRVVNFLTKGTYMQPHCHPSEEKSELMIVVSGLLGLIYFSDEGDVTKTQILGDGFQECISVPAFTWHTYIPVSEEVQVYEEMNGIYDPKTWKEFPGWAPVEGSIEASNYADNLYVLIQQNQ